MFEIGQQVVCLVDEEAWQLMRDERGPVKGGIYTIRSFEHGKCSRLGLRLQEIVNKPIRHVSKKRHIEVSFFVDFFRPVRRTDISVFTRLLAPTGLERVGE